MSNYNSLKTTINANVKQNGVQAITGQILNSVLNAMVTTLGTGYQFAGVATTATDPGSPDAKVFYIANGKGTYTNFGGVEVTEDDVVVLYWDSSWHKVSTGIASQEKLSELERKLIPLVYIGAADWTKIASDGQVMYATDQKILKGRENGSLVTIPFHPGAIYTYEEHLYVWNGTDLIKTNEQDFKIMENVALATSGYSPVLYQGRTLVNGKFDSLSNRVTTRVMYLGNVGAFYITMKDGYNVQLLDGNSPTSLTDRGYVITNTIRKYKYEGGKPYVAFVIVKVPTQDITPAEFNVGDFLIYRSDSLSEQIGELKNKPNIIPEELTIICSGNNNGVRKEYTSQWMLRKDKRYTISFESDYLSTPATSGVGYLFLYTEQWGTAFKTITSTGAGVQTLPREFSYTPTFDTCLVARVNLSDGSSLKIKVTEAEIDVVDMLKENSKLLTQIDTFKSINLENMMLSGKWIGEYDNKTSYPNSTEFMSDGTCVVGGWQSKNSTDETSERDYTPVLITFNMADPEKTADTHIVHPLGQYILGNGIGETLSFCEDCESIVINDNTIRSIFTANDTRIVYKDFNIATQTFEEYGHQVYIRINGEDIPCKIDDVANIVSKLGLTTFSGDIIRMQMSHIKIGEYIYMMWCFNWAKVIVRSTDAITWEFVTEIPSGGYRSDEAAITYYNGRIFATITGNYGRRTNGGFSQILSYDLATGTWSDPVTLDMYGQEYPAIEVIGGKVYVMHQKLKKLSDTSYTQATTMLDGRSVARSMKSVFVFDEELNLISKTDLYLRRGIGIPHFCKKGNNLYMIFATDPKALSGNQRQNFMFSYVDVRLIDL